MKKKSFVNKIKIPGKWNYTIITVIIVCQIFLALSCGRHMKRTKGILLITPRVTKIIYVQKAPPGPIKEVRPKKSRYKDIWIPGSWKWTGRKYVWVRGYWDIRPGGKVRVYAKWIKSPKGWYKTHGYWK